MRKSVSALLALLLVTIHLSAQNRPLKGKVVSGDNTPVPGATVSILKKRAPGTPAKVSTVAATEDGTFTLPVPNGRVMLQVSAVGFETKEVMVDEGADFVSVTLKETTKGLNEVVVVGYGTQRKKDLTGSVSSVQLSNTEETPIFGTSQMLEGLASGVQVTQTNSQPGSSFTVRVRGTNSISSSSDPLYVIDGYAGADITINPNDISSIEVLKDASATAIYGSRGANGVVMITTKKGTPGPNTVNFDMYTGVQHVGKIFDMMDAKQFATYLNQVTAANAPTTPLPFTQGAIDSLGKGTDWQRAIFRTAPISNYSIGFGGGNDNTRYYLSLNYFTQQGIIINSGYKRGIVRFNIDNKLSSKIHIGLNTQLAYSQQQLANVNTSGGAGGGTLVDA
ncbi:MAG TPA: TonB-dependent receptor plug domain-containing protein, partial [Puia sp.]|nr:TonB-dependent receptor plug domain-containing protein [Puia sp.]